MRLLLIYTFLMTLSISAFSTEQQKELCQHHFEMGAKIEAVIALASDFRKTNSKELTVHAVYSHYEKINQNAKDLVDLEEIMGRRLTSSHAKSVEEATLHAENDLYAQCSF